MELWDLYDEVGAPLGKTHARGVPLAKGEYHLIVDVWIRNSRGEYLISRRCPDKEPFAGQWAPTCGCAVTGDSSLDAALRETEEELGLRLDPDRGHFLLRRFNHGYQSILDAWLFEQDFDLAGVVLQPGETDRAAWASPDEISAMVREGRFIGLERLPYLDMLPRHSLKETERAAYPFDGSKPWYHGSNLPLEMLREGSTITQWRELAEAFAQKPTLLSYDHFGGPITHNGTEPKYLYAVDEPVAVDVDIYQHPRTTMEPGVEFLTRRPLRVKRLLP